MVKSFLNGTGFGFGFCLAVAIVIWTVSQFGEPMGESIVTKHIISHVDKSVLREG